MINHGNETVILNPKWPTRENFVLPLFMVHVYSTCIPILAGVFSIYDLYDWATNVSQLNVKVMQWTYTFT